MSVSLPTVAMCQRTLQGRKVWGARAGVRVRRGRAGERGKPANGAQGSTAGAESAAPRPRPAAVEGAAPRLGAGAAAGAHRSPWVMTMPGALQKM